MFGYLFMLIVKFFVQALALKLSVEAVKAPGVQNKYGMALKLSAGLALAHLLLGLVPWVGGLVYLVVWCAAVMSTYKLSLVRSVLVALLQGVVGFLILKALQWVGLVGHTYAF